MSSSAFTPTTTQVTTEVPVNVPVVTAWQSYTPTFQGFGTVTGIDARWRRVGNSLHAQIKFTSGTLQASTTARISIPSGLTIDSYTVNKIIGTSATQFSVTSGQNNSCLMFVESGQTTNVSFCNIGDGSSTKNLSGLNSQTIFGSNVVQSVQFEVPIAEWAGSGTTTLADRALEEYYATSGTWDANSSTTVTGPDGAAMGGALTLGRTKTITLLSNLLPTDKLFLEMRFGSSSASPWVDASNSGYQYTRQGAIEFGATITSISGNTVAIYFAPKALSSNTTYANVTGAQDWNSTWSWRLRKVSSGAQVGYPISTKNIVGATDGVAPVTGMLGEIVSQSRLSASPLSLTSATAANVTATALTIQAGTWDLNGFIGLSGSATSLTLVAASIGTTSATLASPDDSRIQDGSSRNLSSSNYQASLPTIRVSVSSPTTYYLVGYAIFSGGTANVYGKIQATRIA
jgi:hypothetical protein